MSSRAGSKSKIRYIKDANGRTVLEPGVRNKLKKMYEKEKQKDSILYKFDKRHSSRDVTPKTKSLRSTKSIASQEDKENIKPKKKNTKCTTRTDAEMDDDCPPLTPPRNEMVRLRKEALDQGKDPNWISIIRHNEKDAQLEDTRMQEFEKKARQRFKVELEEQIQRREKAREVLQCEQEAYNKSQKEMFAGWNAEETVKSKKIQEKMNKLKAIRSAQVEELNQRRKREEMKIRYQEVREVRKLQRELQAEKEKEQKKLSAAKEKMTEMLKENKKQKEKMERERLAEETEALALQQQYAEMLKKQEEARALWLQHTYAAQAEKSQTLLAATEANALAEAEAEKRAERQRKEYEAKIDAKEQRKLDLLKKSTQECKEMIAKQIREKEERIRKEIEEDRAYGARIAKEAAAAEEAENKKSQIKKKSLLEQEKYLQAQIQLLKERKREERAEMSRVEKQMNSDLLATIKAGGKQMPPVKVDPAKPFEWRYKQRRTPF